jgi:hypothetical protein
MGYARLKEFRRKAKAAMEVGLVRSTQSVGKLHTRGRDERNVSTAGIHEPYRHGNMNTEKENA